MKLKWILASVSALLILFVVYFFSIKAAINAPETAGEFGDLFGGLNAFFAAIAGFGVVIAIWFQQKQLVLQREELALQREEMRAQRQEMSESRLQLAKQAAVQLMSLHVAIAQLKAEALKCENMADEIDSLKSIPDSRERWSTQIRNRGKDIRNFAEALDEKVRGV